MAGWKIYSRSSTWCAQSVDVALDQVTCMNPWSTRTATCISILHEANWCQIFAHSSMTQVYAWTRQSTLHFIRILMSRSWFDWAFSCLIGVGSLKARRHEPCRNEEAMKTYLIKTGRRQCRHITIKTVTYPHNWSGSTIKPWASNYRLKASDPKFSNGASGGVILSFLRADR